MAAQNYFETVENQLRNSGIDLGSLLRQVASQNSENNDSQIGDSSQSFQDHTMENMEPAESSFEVTQKETPERKILNVWRNLLRHSEIYPACGIRHYPVIKTEQ